MTKRPAESFLPDDELVQVRPDDRGQPLVGPANCQCGRCGHRQTGSHLWTKMAPWGWVCEVCKATLVAYYQQGTGLSGGGGGTDSSVGGPREFGGGGTDSSSGCGGPGGSCADVGMSSAAK